MLPPQLVDEINDLRNDGYDVELTEADGWAVAKFAEFPLPAGYNRATTTLLIKFPMSYKNGRPDMFWTDEALALSNNQVPERAEVVESILGQSWRRFSWHPSNWNPGTDDARTYVEFVNCRLAKVR